jgi:pulcherriminic acid synthase
MELTTTLRDDFDAVVTGSPSVDRYEVFARCRSEAPIFFSEILSSWVLSRYEDVRAVLEDEDGFASLTEGPGAPIFGRTFLQMRGREHNKKAGTVARRIRAPRAFTEGLDDAILEISRRCADALAMGETLDFKADYAMWIPLLVITELTQVSEAGRFRDWYRLIAAGGVQSVAFPEARAAGLDALHQLKQLLTPIIEERRVNPGSDLVSDLAASQYDGEPLSNEDIVSTVAFLLTAGVETTERVLTSLFAHLLHHREEWDHLITAREDRTRLTSISAEAVRFFPPVQGLTRTALAPAAFHDVEIDSGDRVVVLLASANRDESRFPDAQRFDAERFADHPERQFTTTAEIMPFGAGRHHCTGSRLAATEMINAIGEFTRRVAWMEPVGPPPAAEGFILRSPPTLPMILHPAA